MSCTKQSAKFPWTTEDMVKAWQQVFPNVTEIPSRADICTKIEEEKKDGKKGEVYKALLKIKSLKQAGLDWQGKKPREEKVVAIEISDRPRWSVISTRQDSGSDLAPTMEFPWSLHQLGADSTRAKNIAKFVENFDYRSKIQQIQPEYDFNLVDLVFLKNNHLRLFLQIEF